MNILKKYETIQWFGNTVVFFGICVPLYEYIEIQDIVGNSCRSVILVYDGNHYDNSYRVWSPVIIAT